MLSAIQTYHLSKDFIMGGRPVRVLKDININIFPGQLTMIVGPSGCGKTTLLSLITGILTPTEGSIDVNHTKITTLGDAEKIKFRLNNIGFIFQQFNLLPALTAIENVTIPLIAAGVSVLDAEQKAEEILIQMNMGENTKKYPRQLSGGELQRVAIARALVNNPEIIVCDEPTSSLDLHTGEKIMEILTDKARKLNKCVIVVTHDNRIFKYATRIIRMNDGQIESYDGDKNVIF